MTMALACPGCKDSGMGPENDRSEPWYGQVVSEFVNAVLRPDGTVWTWGYNFAGTLGNPKYDSTDHPVEVLKARNVIAIDLSWGAAVAVDKDGNVWFWGNSEIYLGPPNVDTNVTIPIKIAHLEGVKSITINAVHIFLLKKDGTVWYMKLDWYTPAVVEGPRKIEGISSAVSVQKSLALTNDGEIYDTFSYERLQDSLRDIIAVSGTHDRHIIALKRDGTVWGWGANELGQLGNGTFVDSDTPTQVRNLIDVVAISANYDYNLALKKDGTVWFWGFAGRQGDTLIGINTPVQVQELRNVVLIYADTNCLVMEDDGTYWSFSANDRVPKQVHFN